MKEGPLTAQGITRERLNIDLGRMREFHGDDNVKLIGRAMPPWMTAWADKNGVPWSDEPDLALGTVYLLPIKLAVKG